MSYINKNYSLEQFKKDYELAKKAEHHVWCYAVFRLENEEKIPIGVAHEHDEAIELANMDCKETEGKFKDFVIEGVGDCASRQAMKFIINFWKEIHQNYRKNAKVHKITFDITAKEVAHKEKLEKDKKMRDFIAREQYYDELD